MYSNKPAACLVVNELVDESGMERPAGRRRLNAAGEKAVEVTAARLAVMVDQVLGKEAGSVLAAEEPAAAPRGEEREVACLCGSGVAVTRLVIDGQTVEWVALPLIFRHFREQGLGHDEAAAYELFETVKIYNAVPPEAEAGYRHAIMLEYAAYCQKENPS
jgi:hypothetical protein